MISADHLDHSPPYPLPTLFTLFAEQAMGFQIQHVDADVTSADQAHDVLIDPVRDPTRRVPLGRAR